MADFATMRVIDSHVHLYPSDANRDPAEWAAARGEAQWVTLCTRVRRNGQPVQSFPSVTDLLREMDRAGVERAVLLGWYWHNASTCALQNRFYAQCVRTHPDRLSAFATILGSDAENEIKAEMMQARDDGLIGLGELSPHAQGHAFDAAGFVAALRLASEWKWPVNLHVTDPNSRAYPGRVETPLNDFVQLARAHPETRFILAHWGGLLPLRDAAASALPNVYYDTAASPLLYDGSVWQRFFSAVPREKILFGSDFPLNNFPTLDAQPAMQRLIDEAVRANAGSAVLRGTVTELLRLGTPA